MQQAESASSVTHLGPAAREPIRRRRSSPLLLRGKGRSESQHCPGGRLLGARPVRLMGGGSCRLRGIFSFDGLMPPAGWSGLSSTPDGSARPGAWACPPGRAEAADRLLLGLHAARQTCSEVIACLSERAMHFFQKAHPEVCSQGPATAAADAQPLRVGCLLPSILSPFYRDSELPRASSPPRWECFTHSCTSGRGSSHLHFPGLTPLAVKLRSSSKPR